MREHRQLHEKAKGNNTYSTKEEAEKAQKEQNKEYCQTDKYKIYNKIRMFGCRHNWPNPDTATYPKTWTALDIEEYKRQYFYTAF